MKNGPALAADDGGDGTVTWLENQSAGPAHWTYPYLSREVPITRPDFVWATDIPYTPLAHGFGSSFGNHGLAQLVCAGLAHVQ